MIADILEEALAVGAIQHLKGAYRKEHDEVKSVKKYSQSESAPAQHGLLLEFESGDTYEVLIQRR